MNQSSSCLHVITRIMGGGAEADMLNMVQMLADVHIFCDIAVGREHRSEISHSLPKQSKIYYIPHLIRSIHPLYDFLALQEIKKLIKKNKYTLVHTHTSKAGVLGRHAAYSLKVPTIISSVWGNSFHKNVGPTRHLYKAIEKHYGKKTTVFTYVGEDVKQAYQKAKIGKNKTHKVLYSGMDFTPYKKAGLLRTDTKLRIQLRKKLSLSPNLNHLVLTCIGRLELCKNHSAVIKMMPRLLKNHPHTQLCLFGEGPAKLSLQKLCAKLGIEKSVVFAGYTKQLWTLLPACDIHCFTSLASEGLPKVLIQTSLAGIVNVSYEVSGAKEVIKNKHSGYIVPAKNNSAFAQKIELFLDNPHKCVEFGKHAMKDINLQWSMERMKTQSQKLYQNIGVQPSL